MNNITCPHCEQIFEIDAAGYADIAKQVRSAEFEKDLHARLEEASERPLSAFVSAPHEPAKHAPAKLERRVAMARQLLEGAKQLLLWRD